MQSLTKRLGAGYVLGGDKAAIWISKGDEKIVFDIKIKMPKGAIFAAFFKRDVGSDNKVAAVVADKKKRINADTAHMLVGHINDVDVQKNVKYLGFELTRKVMLPCGACAEGKAKQLSLQTRPEVT